MGNGYLYKNYLAYIIPTLADKTVSRLSSPAVDSDGDGVNDYDTRVKQLAWLTREQKTRGQAFH